jgi:hypothetical protein
MMEEGEVQLVVPQPPLNMSCWQLHHTWVGVAWHCSPHPTITGYWIGNNMMLCIEYKPTENLPNG